MPFLRAGRRLAPRRIWYLASTFLVALLVLGPGAGPAAAHATLLSTSPAADSLLRRAPKTVELRFDEPVEVLDGGLRVFDPSGTRVDEGRATTDGRGVVRTAIDASRRGTYTVAWRVLSEDSHNLAGSSVFHVGSRTEAVALDDGGSSATDAFAAAARWLGFAGLIGLVGVALIGVLAAGEPAALRRLRRTAIGSGGLGFVAAVSVLVAQTAQSAGRPMLEAVALAPEFATGTRTGQLVVLRAVACASASGLAAVLWRRAPWATALPALVGMAALTTAGHAWTAPGRTVAVVADLVHLVAVGVWIGGLAGLVVALPVSADRPRLARGFARSAGLAAAAVFVSGSVSAYVQVRSLEALTSTGYGQLLLAKVGGFGLLLGLGWRNRTRLVPKVASAVDALVRSVRVELLVAAVVVALTAGVVNQPPARVTAASPVNLTATTDGVTLQLTVGPGRAGSNDVHLYFFDENSQTLPVDAVEAKASVDDIPARRLDVTPITSSHFSAYGASLTRSGVWTFDVTVVRDGEPADFSLEVPIR